MAKIAGAKEQQDFMRLSAELADAIAQGLEAYKAKQGATAPPDWVVAFLMEMAGQLVAKAPLDIRAAVLVGAIEIFGEASGGVMYDIKGNVIPPRAKH